ncbi:hypothetical protein BH10ACT1_BH10ACT1_33370 [soil metagenome]
MAVELGVGYVSVVPSMKGFGSMLDKGLAGPAALAGSNAGGAASKSFGSKFSGGIQSLARGGALAFGALTAGAVGVGVGLYKVGEAFDDAYDTIRVGTGKTGDALEGLKSDFKAVATAVPTSFDDASTAITDLNKRLGLTGKPLQDISAQFLELSRITDTDLATNVDSLTRVFGDWQIGTDQMPASLDKVYRASQASGIGIDDLSQSVVQFGAPLRNLGFDFDSSLALLAQFNKTGVNTSTVFAGMKAGVGKLAKAGEPVPETFKRVVDEITKLGPGSAATAKAIELFGQRAGPDLADAIAGGKFELDGMLGAITGGSDTIMQAGKDTMDFGEKFQILKNKVLVKLEPIATRVFDAIGNGMDKLGPIFDEVVGGFSAFAAAFKDGGDDITSSGLAGYFEGFGLTARDTFDKLKPVVTSIAEKFVGLVTAIKPFVTTIASFVAANPAPFFAGLATVFGVVTVASIAMAIANAAAMLPFYLLVGAVALVVAGFVLAYQKVDWFRTAVNAVVQAVIVVAQTLITQLITSVKLVVGAVTVMWSWFNDKVMPVLRTVASFVAAAMVQAFALGRDAIGWIISKASSAYTWFNDNLLPVLRTVATAVSKTMTSAFNTGRDAVGGVIDKASSLYTWFNDNLMPVIKTIGDTIGGAFSTAFGTAKTAISGVVTIIETVIRTVQTAIDKVSDLILSAKGAAHLDVGAALGGAFAAGGRPPVGRISIVGERGPELFVPDVAGTIIPNHQVGAYLSAASSTSMASTTMAGIGEGGARPGVEFSGPMYVNDPVDVDVLLQKATFAQMAGSLG